MGMTNKELLDQDQVLATVVSAWKRKVAQLEFCLEQAVGLARNIDTTSPIGQEMLFLLTLTIFLSPTTVDKVMPRFRQEMLDKTPRKTIERIQKLLKNKFS